MAERSALSLPEADAAFPEADAARDEAGPAGVSRASRWAGRLAGDVTSATVPWANVRPVIVPQVLRLTSAVVCCHVGFVPTSPGAAGP